MNILLFLLTIAIFIFLVVYFNTRKKSIVLYLPLILTIIELIRVFVDNIGLFTGFYGTVLLAYLLIVFISNPKLKDFDGVLDLLWIFIIMTLFFLIQTDFSDGIHNGLSRLARFMFIFVPFFLGYKVVKNSYDLSFLNKNMHHACQIFVLITFIFTIFEFGKQRGIIYGFKQDEIYFLPLYISIVSLIFILNNKYKLNYLKGKNILFYSILSLFIIGGSLSRTTWLILIVFVAVMSLQFYKSEYIRRGIIFLVSGIIIIGIYVYSSGLYQQRVEKLSLEHNIQNIQTESRIVEVYYIHEIILDDINKRVLGSGEFLKTSIPFVTSSGERIQRHVHSTYNRLLHGVGYIGILIFLIFNVIILYKIFKINIEKNELKIFKTIAISMILSFLVAVFSGIHYAIAYPTIFYLYIGSLLGYLQKYENNNKILSSNYLITSLKVE